MKKLLFALILVALLATSLIGAAGADDGFTYVYPIDDGLTVDVPAGNTITLQWFWLAVNKGLTQNFLRSFSASYAIYDAAGNIVWSRSPAEAEAIWGPVQQTDPSDWDIKCAMPKHWVTPWEVGGIELAPGIYTLVTEWSYSKPINDGWHVCRDLNSGDPLVSPPSIYKPASGTWTVTINVH